MSARTSSTATPSRSSPRRSLMRAWLLARTRERAERGGWVMDRMLRPKVEVLPASAQVPAQNLIVPPPNRFTHEVTVAQPYYYDAPGQGAPPDGEFPAGTK